MLDRLFRILLNSLLIIVRDLVFLNQFLSHNLEHKNTRKNRDFDSLEPSYLTKSGSTIRMDWKKSDPKQYAMYFHCKTKLVDTFKEIYRDKFNFEGNRAIVFSEDEEVPIEELKHCIALSLTYHSKKHLPMLGV